MTDLVLTGSMLRPALRAVVLGRDAGGDPVTLPDGAPGLVLRGTDAGDRARVDFYAAVLDMAAAGAGPGGADGDAADLAWARDVMALFGQVPPQAIAARLHPMRVRASSRVAAMAGAAPTTLRRAAGPDDLAVVAYHQPYARFFAIEEYDIAWRRFDGTMSEPHTRAVFVSGDAVTVLPYDPVRDRVLLVEQFRAGPFGRGDPQPWQLEPIAGRVDPGETPEDAARREAEEEAGLALGALLHVAGYYPTPGAKSEYLHSYVALADLPDGCAGVFGVATEAEDIRGHLVAFDALMGLIASGEVANGPLILTALWLARTRDGLRAV